jgi:large subunit ribosomal protein L21e
MVKASKGPRRRTRKKLQRHAGERGLSPITRALQTYEVGEKANIVIDPSVHKGQPHHRYHGHTGTVVGVRGRAYLLEVRTGGKRRTLIVRPEHLRRTR